MADWRKLAKALALADGRIAALTVLDSTHPEAVRAEFVNELGAQEVNDAPQMIRVIGAMERVQAALDATRELIGPIIAMTVTLAAVYAPIGFQGGLTGSLFLEFAITLVAACDREPVDPVIEPVAVAPAAVYAGGTITLRSAAAVPPITLLAEPMAIRTHAAQPARGRREAGVRAVSVLPRSDHAPLPSRGRGRPPGGVPRARCRSSASPTCPVERSPT